MAKLPTINLALYAQTHVGMVRSGNEDNFLILDLSTGRSWTVGEKEPHDLLTYSQGNYGSLLAVSDGMGGALAGEVASRMAVETVRDRMLRLQAHSVYGKLSFAERLRLSIEEANLLINRESQTNPAHKGLGATFTAVAAHGDQVYFAQVGDSRAYLIRQGKIHRITKDQSLTQQLIDAGQVTEEEAQTHSYRNVILQALGAHSRVNVEVNALALCNLDTLVLCSDGASGKISQDEIARVVREAPDFKSACQQMINLANQRGGGDNITVVVAQFSSPSLALPSGDSIAPQSLGRSPDTPTEINWGAGMPTDPSEKADSPDGSAPEDAETQATEPLPAPPTRSKPYKFFEEDNTMDNLTIEERLVKEAPDTNPMVGHKVVIFEQVGEGSEFRQVLKPGERFEKRRKSLFGPAPVYFAYAVNTDQQLRLEFSDRFLHKDQVHSFDLTFRVEYCAADDDDGMRRLAERVNSDPLKRLQDEIKRVLGRAIAGLEWETIKTNCVADNFKEVAHAVLTDAAAGQASSNFNNLCRFATELGIKLKAIELICNLVEEDIRRDLAALEAERAASLAQIQQQTALSNKLIEQQMQKHELQRQQELALIQQRYDEEKRRLEQEAESRLMGLRQENEQRQQQHANNISDLQLQAEFRKTLVKNADMALGNLANDVGSAESFVRAGNAVAQTFSQIIQTAGSANALPGAGVPPLALSAADSGNLSPLLNEAFEQIAQLTCDPHEKKHLRAAILHLSAELSLGEEADAGIVSHYGEQIKTLTDKLKGTLSREQFDFLCDIQQTERLKKFLKQG